jgi:glutamine amidotransferase
MKTIGIVDYGMGNLRSVQKALEKIGAKAVVTDSPRTLKRADAVVLPGVGAFGEAMKRLHSEGIIPVLRQHISLQKPFLGICLGLQLLFDSSAESPGIAGLGIFRGTNRRFQLRSKNLKVPHMGWNGLIQNNSNPTPLFNGIGADESFYFVHSFFPEPKDESLIATKTEYGQTFCSAIARGRLFACQFHPEKSGDAGLQILRNFFSLVSAC